MNRNHGQKGFTLLEVMLVLALMGIAVSIISFTNIGQDPRENLRTEAERLQVVFDMASDYAVLNQQQLGLYIEESENTYRFVYLNDDEEWVEVDNNRVLREYKLDEGYELRLNLSGLPWENEDSLFDQEVFDEELSVTDASVQIGEEKDAIPPPQILIMSSGDITPFELSILFDEAFDNNEPIEMLVQGREYTPLLIKDPNEIDQI